MKLQLGNITAIHGDCMEYMKSLPDKSFDLAIVDPPYGIDINKSGRLVKEKKRDYKNWDTDTPSSEYFKDLFRVSNNQIIWGGNYFDLKPTRCFIIWDKAQPEQLSFAMCEQAWTSFDTVAKIFRYSVQKHTASENKIHPTQKPIELYRWLLANYAKQGDKILDTHGGSFSHAIACHDLDFELTIIEKDEDYFNAAIKRLKWHQRQQTLQFT